MKIDINYHNVKIHYYNMIILFSMYLNKLLNVLEVVVKSGTGLTVTKISEITNIPRPSCYKLINDLQKNDLLRKKSENKYVLGERFKQIARLDFQDVDVKYISKPLLQKSVNNFEVTFFLSRLRDQGVEIIYVETPSKNQISYLHPGHGFRPLHACSCGKAIAAFASEDFQLNVIHSRLKSYTRNTRINPSLLKSEFKKIRAKGYAECIEEIDIGICSVAAPVIMKDMSTFLSLGATGPLRIFSNKFREKIGDYLIEISNELGSMLENKNIWIKNLNSLAS